MSFPSTSSNNLLSIYLALAQYPILSSRIRERMRTEMFKRQVINPIDFEAEVRSMAVRSQRREGLTDPLTEEPTQVWELRVARVRDQLTDLKFSQNLPFGFFEELVNEILLEQGLSWRKLMLSLNPELAPLEMVFEQALTIEKLPPTERFRYEARLKESKVVLIRSLISDQLRYINIAKEWFNISDLIEIRQRKIGNGRIGGKAAGMLLAMRILQDAPDSKLRACLRKTESFYVGADEMYSFMSINNLTHWNDQKYKSEADMRAEYPQIVADFEQGSFLPDSLEKYELLLANVGQRPLIVRSSSLLEDNFGTAFAGKYESVFLPNHGTLPENMKALTRAVTRVYASTLNPNALLYRRTRGLADYDERMALLIQVVNGEPYKKYYLPHAAGVAFSRNQFRWTPQIRREDGFVRLVWGLGTRAVDRVGNDYPRLIALSHPLLRPSTNPKAIRRYSQQYVDLIDLEKNEFTTVPVHDVLDGTYSPLRYIAQVDEDGYFISLRSSILENGVKSLVITFEDLLRRTPFAEQMREILRLLESNYHAPVDMEFTLHLDLDEKGMPNLCINLLQCRPQSHLLDTEQEPLPTDLREEDMAFSTHFVVPQGHIPRVDYVVFVPHEAYFALSSQNERSLLARAIGRLNAALHGKPFICVGPGRWGSSNSDLGVPIDYGDIYNARALVELAGAGIGPEPEPSLGTHFFQDLLEAQIYPLAVYLDDHATVFNKKFFYEMPDHVAEWIELEPQLSGALRLIVAADYRADAALRVVMNDDMGQAVAFFQKLE